MLFPCFFVKVSEHGSVGLTHLGQEPHVSHDPVLLPKLFDGAGHRGEVPATRLDGEVCVQRQVQLLWLFWLGPLLCLLFFEAHHLCECAKPALVNLLVEGFKIRLAGQVIFWNVRSVFLPICWQTRDGLAVCPCDGINFGFNLGLNLALFPCCDELHEFAFVGKPLLASIPNAS